MHDLAELVAGIECSKTKLNFVIKQLHMLNLSSSRIEMVPSSIGKLKHLMGLKNFPIQRQGY